MKTSKMTKHARGGLAALRTKLMSATAMLLVSAILMVSTSYAWYVLSTAPEVSNIKTQVGANGALEIALLNQESWNDLTLLDMGDIDESVTDEAASAIAANLTWGNLVNLGDSSYGMDKIVLNPARLSIAASGTDTDGTTQYVISDSLLKIPEYNEDGRVKRLNADSALAYTYNAEGGAFDVEGGYGVRAIGTSVSMSVFQLGMNAARNAINTNIAAARTAASNALNETGGDLATVVLDHYMSNVDSFSVDKVKTLRTMAVGFQNALEQIEATLRQTFAGYITTTDAEGITGENYQEKLNEITGESALTLEALLEKYPGIEDMVAMDDYIEKLRADQKSVQKAVNDCDEKIARNTNVTWNEINSIVSPLVDVDQMTIAGMTVPELKKAVSDGGDITDLMGQLTGGGLTVTVPSGSGLLSDVADFAGDYTASITMTGGSLSGFSLAGMTAGMVTKTDIVPPYLTRCGNGLKDATVADAAESSAITDYYGYAIDLAFRTNAADSALLLQTEPQNRVYEGDNGNANLQGGGSTMSFTSSVGISATKMVRLLKGIRVAFMDGKNQVLAIAAPDCTLGQDVYIALEAAEQESTGKYAYLSGATGAYQSSDLIAKAEYEALQETSAVTFNKKTGKVTAKLYLYDFEMTKSATSTEDETKYTGGITLKGRSSSAAITALTQDEIQKVTAVVYLDGSVVNNASVAANALYSMTGSMNLQFSSSATLVPAENNALRSNGADITYTELDNAAYKAGYCNFDGGVYKLNDDVRLYEGSDGQIYYSADGENYTQLSASSEVLTEVTATLSGNSNADVDDSFTLTAALDSKNLTNLTVVKYELKRNGAVTKNDPTGKFDVTESEAGSYTYQAVLTVEVGSGDNTGKQSYAIETNVVTVTVAGADTTE